MISHMEDEKANIEKNIHSVLHNDCFETYFLLLHWDMKAINETPILHCS